MTRELKITTDENTVGIWFLSMDENSDFCLWLDREDTGYAMTYRFRYYANDKTFTGEDTKNWYKTEPENMSREKAIEGARDLISMLEGRTGNKGDEVLMVDGDVDLFIEELKTRPWFHVKEFSKEELEKLQENGGDNNVK